MQDILHLVALPAERRTAGLGPSILAIVRLWRERNRSRQQLAQLDDRDLADIGITCAEQWLECEKPFWKA